jgi:hypothetical protein
MHDRPLPEPESEQLAALTDDGAARLVYGLLYRRRRNPPTAAEIRFFLDAAGSDNAMADAALRSLGSYFDIAVLADGETVRYELRGWSGTRPASGAPPLSLRRRAQALAPGLCAQCGRSPLRHGIALEVDLRVPPDWGGTTDPENLQPLCEECHEGKRQHLETYAPYSDQIRHAANCAEPQRRIGELLLALKGEWVPSDLIGIVASAREYQADFERRLRDLRFLGWEIKTSRRYHEGPRVRAYYQLVRSAPWPESIRAAITAEEKRRAEEKRAKDASKDGQLTRPAAGGPGQ